MTEEIKKVATLHDLRQMSEVERFEYFYNQRILPQLETDVLAAEEARKGNNRDEVEVFASTWLGNQEEYANPLTLLKIEKRMRSILSGVNSEADDLHELFSTFKQLDDINQRMRVGLAGLGRIIHVTANQHLTEPFSPDTDQILTTIEFVESLYQRLVLSTLIQLTIDRKEIDWETETDQDRATTANKLGNTTEALVRLDTAQLRLASQQPSDLKTKSQAITTYRSSVIEPNLSYATDAVRLQLSVTKDQNIERLRLFGLNALKHAFSERQEPVADRLRAGLLGTKSILTATVMNPKETITGLLADVKKMRAKAKNQ